MAMSEFRSVGVRDRIVRSARVVWNRWARAPFRPVRPLHKSVWTWVFVALLAATVALFMFVYDTALTQWATQLPQPIVSFFKVFTELGQSAWLIAVSGIGGLVLAVTEWGQLSRPRRVRRAKLHADFTFFFAVTVASGLLIRLIKDMIGRARPNNSLSEGPLHFEFLAFSPQFASFPSGHAATFGAACTVMALYFPRWRPMLLLLALAGGASRVIVGWHYPADVIAGLAAGAAIALVAARYLARRNVMFVVPEGKFMPIRSRLT